ncbi:MAG: nuclease-related domain-containing protein, partial [Syntrophobacteraceae bacterium]
MGISIKPEFLSLILIAPKSIISRPSGNGFDTGPIIKADALRTKIDEMADKNGIISDLASFTKISSIETVEEFAKKLVSLHRPIKIDFRAKFGLQARQD